MSEKYTYNRELDLAQREKAFIITKSLFSVALPRALIIQGLALYFGDNDYKINPEMRGIDAFISDETTISIFRTERGAPYMVWGMVIEFLKQNPDFDVTKKELLSNFIQNLPQKVYEAYSQSAASGL